ncbi:recombination mediator RecR [Ravibacter arvi]|uniref:Recombination protein RecR n=1 Tax=Ravibacter arvi TaxID=2051041 RepID=A0ABP8M171_9BACT
MNYPSKLIENAVNEISRLPGIGKKSALRLALHLLKRDAGQTKSLADSLVALREQTCYCVRCHNIADSELCGICSNKRRDASIICVVTDTRDVLAIENTAQFNGLYHVLGGVISPMEGIGPGELNIDSLLARVADADEPVVEVILALSATMEGDTTAFYLQKKLKESNLKVSTIARGIPVGGDLEFTDEVTLGRSIVGRLVYQ